MSRRALGLVTLLSLTSAPFAQDVPASRPLPGVRYRATVPTPEQVLGRPLGAEVSLHAEIETYLRALAAASDRIKLVEYGRSWEGRRLWYAVLATPERLAKLPGLQAGWQRLADPRTLAPGEGEKLCVDLPAVAWLANCVHGDEPSGSDAALMVAWHLLAAEDDALVSAIFANLVVVIDPLQNPDGRDRFVHGTRAARGLEAAADPDSAEHTQPWPGGRVNHYLFDMNRDWFAMSQPETVARVRAFQAWWPQVYVDLHEMGGNSTYYFAPPALPLNPEITTKQRAWLERYGRNNAAWFDRAGVEYFTRENYDSFYPGYGEGWPTFQGSIGMTFEQGSSRGLVFRRRDDSLLHYRECVRNHFLASLGTLETLAGARQDALEGFLEYRRTAIAEGTTGPVAAYLFPERGDPTRLARLVNLLTAQGIEVQRATAPITTERATPLLGGSTSAQTFPAGTYVVRLDQPAKRLATVLLGRHFEMDAEFLARQKEREKRRKEAQFYDLTAWSLPLLFDVETWVSATPPNGAAQQVALGAARPAVQELGTTAPKVAYVVPWSNGAAALLVELLAAGVKVRTMDRAFKLGGTEFAPGTYVVKIADQPADLHERMRSGSARHGVRVVPTDTSWVESGIHFGSNSTHVVAAPKVAIAWDRPVQANSAGWARFVLERRYGLPVTPIRVQSLATAELERYTVLVLPDGGAYAGVLGKAGAERLQHWVDRGGVLVAIGGATRWLAEEGVGLLASKAEDRQGPPKPKSDADSRASRPAEEPFDYEKAIRPDKEPPPRTPGAILAVTLDPEHWLAFGYAGRANVVSESHDIFTPVKLDRGTNVAVYETTDKLLLAGFTWEESKKQLAQKAWLVHQPRGKGHVVAFAEDPNLRAFADGLNLLFLNAILLGSGR